MARTSGRSKPALKEAEGAHDLRYASDTGGLETPRGIALAGFDNEPWTELVGTGPTVIEQPVADIGRCPEDELTVVLARRSSGWLSLRSAGRSPAHEGAQALFRRTDEPAEGFSVGLLRQRLDVEASAGEESARVLDLVDAGRLDAGIASKPPGRTFRDSRSRRGRQRCSRPGRHVLSAKRADAFETSQKGDASENQMVIAPRARNYSPFVQPD